jgi:protein O-GlcNAc transferase
MLPMSQFNAEQALQIAVQHHRAGEFSQAEVIYRQVLDRQPDNADALHCLGVLLGQAGKSGMSADLIRRALDLV